MQVAELQKTFAPYQALWRMCSDFLTALPDWMDGPFTDINAEAMAEDVDKWLRATYKLTKVRGSKVLYGLCQKPTVSALP